MLSFLKKIVLWSLGIICLGIAITLVVFTIWWLNLPIMGFLIFVCIMAALVILFFAVRRLRIWLNKRKYVKQILTQNPITQNIAIENQNPMLQAWHKGMDVFANSTGHSLGSYFGNFHNNSLKNSLGLPTTELKKINAVYRQSWALMLGRDFHESKNFIQSLTGSAPTKSNLNDPLRWHFLPDMVLLEADASLLSTHDPIAQGQWEELLTQLADGRTKEPINALIITINAKDLYAKDAQDSKEIHKIYSEKPELHAAQVADLREYGNLLRSRIGQVLAVSFAKLPIYILVNGINELHGMHNLPHQIPDTLRKKLLGACFTVASNTEFDTELVQNESRQEHEMPSIHTMAKESINNAENDINTFIADKSVQGNFPKKDELYAPLLFQRLEEGLCIFLESLMRPTPHGLSPLLRCIAFTCNIDEQEELIPLMPFVYEPIEHTKPTANAINNQIIHNPLSPIMANNDTMHLSISTISVTSTLSSSVPNNELIDQNALISTPSMPSNMQNTLPQIMPESDISSGLSQNASLLNSLQNAMHNENEVRAMPSNSPRRLEQTCFISDLFTHILPADRLLYQPLNKTGLREAWIFPSFLGYYLLLFAFCAMLAMNTIYTTQILKGITSKLDSAVIPIPTLLKPLQHSYERINYLKNAQSSWIFPFIGQNSIALEQQKEEEIFISIMRNSVLPIILQDITNNNGSLTMPTSMSHIAARKDNNPATFEDLKKIIWMQEALSLRSSAETSLSMREKPFPITQSSDDDSALWSIGFGELFLHFLDISSVKSLISLQAYLSSAVQNILNKNGEYFFTQMESIVNAEMPTAAIPISRFWPTMPGGSPYFTSIPPIFTVAGFNRMYSAINNIWKLNHAPDNKMEDNPHWQQYLIRYAMAWEDFVVYTDYAWINVTRISTLKDMVKISKSRQGAYLSILSTMSENLEPLRNNPISPRWIDEVFLLHALSELASTAAKSNVNSFLTTPSILINTIKSSPKNMEVLQKLMDTHNPTVLVDIISSLAIYFNALNDIRATLASDDGSFELARLQFGGKEYGNLAESSFTIAQNSLLKTLSLADLPLDFIQNPQQSAISNYNNESPAVVLLQGSYRFLSHAITCVAAQKLQKIWESSIMPAAILLPTETAAQVLFDEQGLITTFLATEAAPFFHRQVGYYNANSFAGNIFPFTFDFLDFIQQGQEIKQIEPKESYDVNIMSQTGSLNPDATEYLQYMELSLHCKEKIYTLRNSNYPESAVFSYNPKSCTKVTLDFHFPSVQLQYTYNEFTEFLHDFSYGEREFNSYDFPTESDTMERLGIKRINVRIFSENASEVLNSLDFVPVPLPVRICRVW